MSESIITISIAGFLAGFIFSMPIAGPISILITSNALRGRVRYCNLVSIGASFATFAYVFFAVYGLTKLYHFYKPLIPYLFSAGSIFLLFLGYRIFRIKIDIDHFENNGHSDGKIKKKEGGGFYTGFIINLLNPTLFAGWLTSTFFVISFIVSLGFNSGGLDIYVKQGVKDISSFEGSMTESSNALSLKNVEIIKDSANTYHYDSLRSFPSNYHLIISVFYAFFISAGSIIWFYILAILISRFRKSINTKIITVFIKCMGVILCLFGLYFGYLAFKMIFNMKI